jgi:hypothetical protein
MRTAVKLDRYAKDAGLWRDSGYYNLEASDVLFRVGDPFLWFPAAVLGHHALEMLLKAILIHEGMTAFNPRYVNSLLPTVTLREEDCVWGHDLVELAKKLAEKRPDFDPTKQMICFVVGETLPLTVLRGFEIFDPFFSELRYPREAEKAQGLDQCHGELLSHLYRVLEPFIDDIPPPAG